MRGIAVLLGAVPTIMVAGTVHARTIEDIDKRDWPRKECVRPAVNVGLSDEKAERYIACRKVGIDYLITEYKNRIFWVGGTYKVEGTKVSYNVPPEYARWVDKWGDQYVARVEALIKQIRSFKRDVKINNAFFSREREKAAAKSSSPPKINKKYQVLPTPG